MTAVVGAAGVILLPLALSVCDPGKSLTRDSSPTSDPGAPHPPIVQAAMGMPVVPIDPYLGPSEHRATGQRAPEKSAPVASAEARNLAPPSTKVRRIEDLPTAGPVAVRPLRPEELPAAGPGGKSRRAKGAAASAASEPMAPASSAASAGGVRGLRIEDLPSVSAAVRPLRPEELNPDLVRRADDLLWNSHAPVGTDIPFELNGRSYVARFAIHYHEFGGTKKPWGYHKGVTLYSTAD